MTTIDPNVVEALLNMNESNIVDFKRDPYPFVGASDLQKSELVKDVICFANAWKTTDAHILIGVVENKGGRATVVGVTDHPDDAALQQLVNSKTNRNVAFQYLAVGVEGKTIGIIRIAKDQEPPLHLVKDFGKVKANAVWMKLNSGSAEAKPDEIARMGAANVTREVEPTVKLEWAEPKTKKRLGTTMSIVSRVLPDEDPPEPKAQLAVLTVTAMQRPDPTKVAEYERQMAKLYEVAVCVENLGSKSVTDVRIELEFQKLDDEIIVTDSLPPKPRPRFEEPFIAPVLKNSKWSAVREVDKCWVVECRLGKVQPSAVVFSAPFYVAGLACCDDIPIAARIFGDTMKAVDVELLLNTRAYAARWPPPPGQFWSQFVASENGFSFDEDE